MGVHSGVTYAPSLEGLEGATLSEERVLPLFVAFLQSRVHARQQRPCNAVRADDKSDSR